MYTPVLKTLFGFDQFRPGQLETIEAVLDENRPTLSVLPTSTGKTLIFQFITIMKRRRVDPTGITVVISPLVALMVDQVAKWNALFAQDSDGQIVRSGTAAAAAGCRPVAVLLGSAQTDTAAEPDAIAGRYPVVYMAPEKLPYLADSIVRRVQFLVIDECHCISEHGNSFRPAYRNIRTFFGAVPTLALTATAPPSVQDDILQNLALENPRIIRTSMYRPNLRLTVSPKQSRSLDLVTINQALPAQGRTVIFGTTRTECASLARLLGGEAYHAGMDADARTAIMARFLRPGAILVATNCFGMGVDIPDIRLVVHYGLPRSLLGYVQECGRAGRDGAPADCLLLFAPSDMCKYNETERDVRQATEMLAWTRRPGCRHRSLLSGFGETDPIPPGPCGRCDACDDNTPDPITVTSDDIDLLLRAAHETGGYSGRRLPIDLLLGSKSKKIRRFVHGGTTVYAKGCHHTSVEWSRIHRQLVVLELLQEIVTNRGFVVYRLTSAGTGIIQ